MTLQTYDAKAFDDMAARLVELSGKFKEVAKQQRQLGLKSIDLNDRKLLEWISYIEIWAQSSKGRQMTESVRQRGTQRAEKVKGKKG